MRYGRLVKETLAGHPVELVDLAGINEEELLFRDADVPAVVEKFRAADVDALFFPHCNFGSENCVAQVAREFRLPVLLWGPRDDAPDAEGLRSRDSQCGLFATGKVLRRHNVPFTYLTNSWADSREFHTGIDKFLRVASVVKAVTRLKILQISTRPAPFCSVICNENELIERFGIQCCPVTLDDLVTEMERVMAAREPAFRETCGYIRSITAAGSEEDIHRAAGLKLAMPVTGGGPRLPRRGDSMLGFSAASDGRHALPVQRAAVGRGAPGGVRDRHPRGDHRRHDPGPDL